MQKPGMISASVALTTSHGRFVFNPDTIGVRDIIHHIKDLGFNASIPSNDESKNEALSHAKTIKKYDFWFLASFSISYLLNVGNSIFYCRTQKKCVYYIRRISS